MLDLARDSLRTLFLVCAVPLLLSACDDGNGHKSTTDPVHGNDAGGGDGDVDAGPPPASCCPAGDKNCAANLLPCPIKCPDGTLCSADQRCAESADGKSYQCASASSCQTQCGNLCCASGAACVANACVPGDLTLEAQKPSVEQFVREDVPEGDCRVFDGCFPGSGRRSLIKLDVQVKNVGSAAIDLGQPWHSAAFRPSFCQGSYVLDDFIEARVLDKAGKVLSKNSLPTRCVAAEGGAFTCSLQGLMPGESSAQPSGSCGSVDVTGLAKGDYQLELTVNPKHTLAESNFANNKVVVPLSYPDCDGTLCGGVCCPGKTACVDNVCLLPDLRMNGAVAKQSLFLTHYTAETNSCELSEMCVTGSGERRVLEFESRVENWGPGDLNPGKEEGNPLFEWSQCHQHYHFKDFSDYKLLKKDGSVAAQGHKQSFCLADSTSIDDPDLPAPPNTHPEPGETGCSYLTAGFADIYGVGTPCQWIDITDVAPGDYTVRIAVNPIGKVSETDVSNNVVEIPITIPADGPCVPKTEICGNAVDDDCDQMPDYEDEDCTVDPNEAIVTGNDTCATAHALTAESAYRTTISADTKHDTALACGGAGGQAFFALDLAKDEIIYLDSIGSDVDTVLAVLPAGCSGAAVACESSACGSNAGQFAGKLAQGSYVVAVQAKDAGSTGKLRLHVAHSGVSDAKRIEHSGLFEGDTSARPDSVDITCGGGGGPIPVDGDLSGDAAPGHEGIDELEPPPIFGDGGVNGGGNDVKDGPDDVYYLAHCGFGTFYATTCGTAAYDSALAYYDGTTSASALMCTYDTNGCSSDPNGATLSYQFGKPGVSFLVVDSADGVQKGVYQLQVSF